MSSSHQFAIMSLHAGQKNSHEVCANYLSHSAISSIDSGKGSLLDKISVEMIIMQRAYLFPLLVQLLCYR